MNKKDLFKQKIEDGKSIGICFKKFPGFGKEILEENEDNSFPVEGPHTPEAQMEYLRKKFLQMNANPKKQIWIHATCATDTNQVQ
jgi:hypothetical protein